MNIDTVNPCIELSAHDRCDRCGAQAYAVAAKDNQDLLFCGHHIKQHSLALEMSGWEILYDYVALEQIAPGYRVPV